MKERIKTDNFKIAILIGLMIVMAIVMFATNAKNTEKVIYRNENTDITYVVEKYEDLARASIIENYVLGGVHKDADISEEVNAYNIDKKYTLSAIEALTMKAVQKEVEKIGEGENEITPDIVDKDEPNKVFTGSLKDLENMAKGNVETIKTEDEDTKEIKTEKSSLFELVKTEVFSNTLICEFERGEEKKYVLMTGIGTQYFKIEQGDSVR